MARQALFALLVVALASASGVVAQTGGSGLTGGLTDFQCLTSADNRNAGFAVAQSCGDLASGITTTGGSINVDCTASCGAAFNLLTPSCRDDLASSSTLGSTYRLIFDACGVSYTGSSGTPTVGTTANGTAAPSAPTANTNVNGSEFTCLADRDNLDAGVRFARSCSGGALQPRPDRSSDAGFTVTCTAACSAALNDVTQSCINSIANSTSFGGFYQEIFRACGVRVSNSTAPTRAPTAAAATSAPTAAGATSAPTEAPTSTATGTPTSVTAGSAATAVPEDESPSGPTTSGEDAPTAAPTAPPTQSATRATGSLAVFGVAAAVAAALLTLLA